MSSLKSLAQQILVSVERLEAAHAGSDTQPPPVGGTFKPTVTPEAERASRDVILAATQLLASVRSPMEMIMETCTGMFSVAAMNFVNEHNIADILQEAGPKGLPAKEIGAKIGADGTQVGRALRFLSTRFVFREVEPNVFANNKHSAILLKNKPVSELVADPVAKYDNAPAAAVAAIFTDETFMASRSIPQFLKDPGNFRSPFSIALNDNTDMFAWFNKPENAASGRRFAAGWKGLGDRHPPELFTSAIDWKALEAGSTVVDVGANVGTVTLFLAKAFPHLRYIVQDLEFVINKTAKSFWSENCPEAITDGLVELQVHDFFKVMPITADIYFMRFVIHDWPEVDAMRIMKNVRAAAQPSSKLILFENVIPQANFEESEASPSASNGEANTAHYMTMIDLQMMTMQGGRERTIVEFTELGNVCGWKLDSVKPGKLYALVFVPA
ncbi:hypothetical protein HGRIS_006938 [Hohenbuehelia grisea]|uniref:O-methyltransferase C-terminal domain-containing protein n=1 Tax=Hohenbuehelia grisea TaxID=104357 RepID=A0ABR3JAW2_9AGAR